MDALRQIKGERKRSGLLGARCVLLLVCCLAPSGVLAATTQPQEERKPDVELKGVELKGVDLSNKTADVLFSVAVKNPGLAFKLKDLNYRLSLNDYQAAEGKYEKEVEIAAGGETVVELPFTFDLTKIPGVAWNAMTESFTLRYELETEFTVPLFGSLKHTQKTSFKGDFPLTEALTSLPTRLKEKLFGKP